MTEFTDAVDTADNTGFSDSPVDVNISAPQEISETTATTNTGDSSFVSSDATDAGAVEVEVTPTPMSPTQDSAQDSTGDATTGEQDVCTLLQQLQMQQQEYQTQVTETAQTLTEQAKNSISCLVLIIILIGFLSGLVLARSVWRKL